MDNTDTQIQNIIFYSNLYYQLYNSKDLSPILLNIGKNLQDSKKTEEFIQALRDSNSKYANISASISSLLKSNAQLNQLQTKQNPIRIYFDGCFDILHQGHYNAIRQAKLLGDQIIVGVITDEQVYKAKGPSLFTLKERIEILQSCKWVDEVYEQDTYDPTLEQVKKRNCQCIAHGDDPVIDENGVDGYEVFKKHKMLKIFKRTEGVSSTDIVGKLLQLTDKVNYFEQYQMNIQENNQERFLATSKRIVLFSDKKEKKEGEKVVYIDGDWDVFNNTHTRILKKAKEFGDYLVVGIYDDETVRKIKGDNLPIFSLNERVLTVLANRYVDDVIIGAPLYLSTDLIKTFNVQKVVQAQHYVESESQSKAQYQIAIEKDMFEVFEVEIGITIEKLKERVLLSHEDQLQRFNKGSKKNYKYYNIHKQYVEEVS